MTKTNVPELRFRKFDKKWNSVKFGNLYKKNVEKNETNFDKTKTISISKMKFNKEGNGANKSSLTSYKVLRVGDIAFEGHKNKNFEFGRFVLNDLGDGIMSPRFTSLRPIKNQYIPFMKYLVHLEAIIRPILVKSTKAGTMMNELVVDDLLKQNVNIPSYKEQQSIGSFFDKIDKLIELQTQKVEQIKKLKRGYLQKMFPQDGESLPRLRFKGFHDEWKECRFSDIYTKHYCGGTPSTKNEDYWSNGTLPWYQSSDLIEGKLVNNKINKKITKEAINKTSAKEVPGGSIAIVTRVGVGKLSFIDFDYSTSQDFISISGLKINDMYAAYLIYRLMYHLKNSLQGTSIKGITKSELDSQKLSISGYEIEQKKIGSFFSKMDRIIKLENQKIDKLKELKKGYLQKMFI